MSPEGNAKSSSFIATAAVSDPQPSENLVGSRTSLAWLPSSEGPLWSLTITEVGSRQH